MNQTQQDVNESNRSTRREFLGAASATAVGATLLAGCGPTTQKGNSTGPAGKLALDVHPPRPTCVVAFDANNAVTCDDSGQVLHWLIDKSNNNKISLNRTFPAAPTAGNAKASFVTANKNAAPANQAILVAQYDGNVSIYNWGTLARTVFPGHQGAQVWTVAVLPDNATAISGDNSGQIYAWDIQSQSQPPLASYKPSEEPIASIAAIPVADTGFTASMFVGFGDGQICKLNYLAPQGGNSGTLTCAKSFDRGSAITINSIAVFQKTAGNYYLLAASLDSRIASYSLAGNGKDRAEHKKYHNHFIWRLAAAPTSGNFASASEDGTVYYFNSDGILQNPTPNPTPVYTDPALKGIMGLDFLEDKRLVVTTNTPSGTSSNPAIAFVPLP